MSAAHKTILDPTILDIGDKQKRKIALEHVFEMQSVGGPLLTYDDHINVSQATFYGLQATHSNKRNFRLSMVSKESIFFPSDEVLKVEAVLKTTMMYKNPTIVPRSYIAQKDLIEVYRPKRVAYGTLSDLAIGEWNKVFGFRDLEKCLIADGQITDENKRSGYWWFTVFSME